MWLFFSNHQNCATLNYPRRYSPLNSSCALPPHKLETRDHQTNSRSDRETHPSTVCGQQGRKERKKKLMVFLSPVGSARRSGPFDPPPSLPMDSRYVRHYDITTTPPPLLPPHSPVPISNLIIDDEMARDDCVWSHPRNAHKRPRTVTTNPRGGLPGPGMIGWPALGQWPVLVRWLARLACSNAIGFFSLSLSLLRPYSGVVVFYLRHVSLSLLFPTRYSLCWSERFLPPPPPLFVVSYS